MAETRFSSLPVGTRAYVGIVVAVGAITIIESLYRLWADPVPWDWTILALLTLVSGSATVRLPAVPATISVSETFVFTSVLLFGPAAGTLTVALDALVISGWSYKKGHPPYKIVFNVCALPLTIWAASHLFFLVAGVEPLFGNPAPVDIRGLIVPLLTLTLVYFGLNSWIITFAIALEKKLRPLYVWRSHFPWLSLNYFGGASVALLLVSYTKNVDYTYLLVILPLLVVLYLTFSVSMGRVEDANKHLTQLNDLYMSTIETLAMAIDAKDQITHGHIRRVQTFAVALAKEIGVSDPRLIKAIEAAALLHDMGKLAVPEYILNKPGPLTPAEFDKMKLHASVGADILSAIDFPYPVVPIVRHHHENWDGSGYPDGIAGTEIPIGARILSVVDCFDALTSDRPYRPRLDDKEATRILLSRRGTMYDPLVVDTFIGVHRNISIPSYEPTTAYSTLAHAARSNVADPKLSSPPFDDIAASTGEMLTLFELARQMHNPLRLAELGDVIVRHLRRLVPFSLCIVYIHEEGSDELVAGYTSGDNASLVSGVRLGVGERLSGWVAAHRQTIRNSDATLDLGEAVKAFADRPKSCLSTPLLSAGSLVGVLTLYSSRMNAFSEEHQRILEVIASQISASLGRAADARRPRVTHVVEGFGDLPTFDEMKDALRQRGSDELPSPTSLILISLDNLKAVAERHAERDVDEALTRLTLQLRQGIRLGDLLFRLQRTELCTLLLQTSEELAEQVVGRLREGLVDKHEPRLLARFSVMTSSQPARLEELVAGARRALRSQAPGSGVSSESIH